MVKGLGMRGLCRRIQTGVLAALIAVLVVTALPLTALAATPAATGDGSFNLIVSPLPIGLQAKPGESISRELQIKNAGLATEHVKVMVMKFGAADDNGTPKLEDPGPGDDFISWVSFSRDHFDAEPNVWTSITMTIKVPPTAAFSYDYAIVFSRDGAGNPAQPRQANLIGSVASLVLLDIQRPGAKSQAQLTGFSMTRKVYEFLPTDFTIRMKNTGNVHVAPRGNIFITRGGKNVGLLEVNQSKGFILPNTNRSFTASWQDGSPVYKLKTANGKVVLNKHDEQERSLAWDNFNPSKLRIGRYTAHLVMVYNDGTSDIPLEGTITFWVIPWRILAVVLLVVLLVLAGLYATVVKPVRNRIKRKKKGNA
jgi:hypothetical protein